ncbi:hypothetical protein [Thermococcus sp. M36]|uniref:hypothetical protein n=1 Tax=Thermococcus sp. M36 TaxID=1638261 RepID=UPI00143BAE8B|nr:hypothetical protein [Thermococcus sp. M36]
MVVLVFIFVLGFWILYYSIRMTICAVTNYCDASAYYPMVSPVGQLDRLVAFFRVASILLSFISLLRHRWRRVAMGFYPLYLNFNRWCS